MRVAIAPSDVQAVADYRVRWPAHVLKSKQQIELVELDEAEFRVRTSVRRHGPDTAVGVEGLPDVDVIVFPRLLARSMVDAIPLIQREGIAVVVDVDDDFRHAPPTLAGRKKIDPLANPNFNWRQLARACREADLVTYSTPPLYAYAVGGHGRLVPNCVPEWFLAVEAERDGSTVGWGGTVGAHPGDLQVTRGGVATAIDEFNGSFMVVGDKVGVREALGLSKDPFGTGNLSHQGYIRRVAEFDVGIAPLADNVYTQAKSGLKVLQYMALGIPWVASTAPQYAEIFGDLTYAAREARCKPAGALCTPRSRSWRREVLNALQQPEDERQEGIDLARSVIREHYLIEHKSWRWGAAWSDAIVYHHDRRLRKNPGPEGRSQ